MKSCSGAGCILLCRSLCKAKPCSYRRSHQPVACILESDQLSSLSYWWRRAGGHPVNLKKHLKKKRQWNILALLLSKHLLIYFTTFHSCFLLPPGYSNPSHNLVWGMNIFTYFTHKRRKLGICSDCQESGICWWMDIWLNTVNSQLIESR